MSYAVITDTSANLPTKLLNKLNISVLPFTYHCEDKSFNCLDTDSFDGDEFYDRIRAGLVVTTSQITPYHYEELFRPILARGEDMLFVGMSSGISGSFHSSASRRRLCARSFPNGK